MQFSWPVNTHAQSRLAALRTGLVGVLLIGYAGLALHSGRLLGRSGLTSLTKEAYPVLFWAVVCLFSMTGLVLVFFICRKVL